MDLLSSLNQNQKEAVMHTEGPLLILAGAGSGKTRVITHRIAHLLSEKRVPPTAIFAVTFTNKAAQEMKNRIMKLAGGPGNSVFARTFHAAAVFILRNYGEAIGLPRNFTIYDQGDQESLIKEVLLARRLDPKKIKPSSVAGIISGIKEKAPYIDGMPVESQIPRYVTYNLTEIFREYHEKLRANNALDFSDLLIETVRLLRTSPETLSRLQSQWRYFMVDEYQDTNYSQYLIAKHLASRSRNLCVVGDDDQSIYSWRGADIRNILDFEKDYPDARVITLNENYRSTQPILDAASAVIRNNPQRREKNLTSYKGPGEPIVWCATNNEYGEAEFVINSIVSLKHRERYGNSSFAIFYRTNAQSRVFEDFLRRENIPYKVVGGLKFYDRKEIRDLVGYLRLIANPRDLIALLRVINAPSRGIGDVTVEKIMEAAKAHGVSEWEAIRDGLYPGKSPKGLGEFRDIIAGAMASLGEIPHAQKLSAFVLDIIERSGYKKALEDEASPESASRLENINEFLNSVMDYELAYPSNDLQQFLQDISLYTTEENPEQNPDAQNNYVTLMTVHNAKGLEFPVVYLTGMEENTFPHRLSLDSEEGIEEERRLCYVGITRGMDRVFLLNAEIRRSYGNIDYKQPSRFLAEIPDDLIQAQSFYGQDYAASSSWYPGPGSRDNRPRKPAPTQYAYDSKPQTSGITREPVYDSVPDVAPPPVSTPAAKSGSKFKLADTVLHPKFGPGRVVGIDGSGDNLKLTIIFGSGRKVFLEKYTPLEKI